MRADQWQHIVNFINQPHNPPISKDNVITFVDMSKPWGDPRFIVYDPKNGMKYQSFHTTMGQDGNPKDGEGPPAKDVIYARPQDIGDTGNKTAKGCYVTGKIEPGPKYGLHVQIYGEESTNKNSAPGRGRPDVFIHGWKEDGKKVIDENNIDPTRPRVSKGCFALDPDVFNNIKDTIQGGSVFCVLP